MLSNKCEDMYCKNAPRSRSNKKQIKVMLEFMLNRKHLENNSDPSVTLSISEWHELKDILKEHGADRTIDQWKQTWKDLKKNLKKRPAHDCINCTIDKHTNKNTSDAENQEREDTDSDSKFSSNVDGNMKKVVLKHLQGGTFDYNQEDSVEDPLLQMKQESPLHNPTLDDADLQIEFDPDTDVSARSITPPGDSGFPALSDECGSSRKVRNKKKEDEIHNLKVAERVWILKTLRAKHDVAQIEKQRAQLERQKARFEKNKAQYEMEKLRLERDLAQLQWEQAQLGLNRARQEGNASRDK